MAVQVPGGQQIYIGADGQVRYATAHSHALPPEAIVGGWFHKGIESACLGPLAHDLADFTDGRGNGGLVLCPVDWTIKGLMLYAKMKGFRRNAALTSSDCK
ncbi:hypothetical protein RRF57_001790 [Xylaria bambusicola]|uniref:Uncharacterized protein n=1 Tax=Xylaria bambusicola TaxID=326684 RepID=A0AAN7YV60_9PEZI